MPPKLPLKAKLIVRGLENLGFVQDRISGSHVVLRHSGDGRRAVVPMHPGDLPKGTVKAILREAQVSVDRFLAK
jgi:predicted RNA binding protein YcfA (HicA-like mRNA interferase family)